VIALTAYQWTVVTAVLLYASLASGLTLLTGKGGLFSVTHALLFGLGAYTTAVLSTRYGWPWAATLVPAMVLATAVATAVSAVSLRVHADYFVIASFGLQLIGTSVTFNWISMTGGVGGISAVPPAGIFGWTVESKPQSAFLMAVTCAFCFCVVGLLSRSPYGRTLSAIRDDEVAARSLGKNVLMFKVAAFAITGALAGLVGSVYASYLAFVGPTDFTIETSILLLAMVIVGGLGTLRGAVVGAVLLVVVPELLRQLDLPADKVGVGQQALYGLILVFFVLVRPEGMFPEPGARDQLTRR
jgi:ABC-type branched-subunit amino acid transport system permease subunit